MQRGADYNLDTDTGRLFFLRSLQAFDAGLNLQQVVVTYEYDLEYEQGGFSTHNGSDWRYGHGSSAGGGASTISA